MNRSELVYGQNYQNRQGIFYIQATDPTQIIFDLLIKAITSQTALFLSGGSTPKKLYEILSKFEFKAGAVGLIDERYGPKFHENSNEFMIRGTGFLSKLDELNIPFYPILENKEIEQTARDYDETLRYLMSYVPKSIGILGIGEDGHTAGIPAISEIAERIEKDQSSLAEFYDDEGKYGKRISMTFNALSRLDLILILVTGKEKKKTLSKMFEDGPVSEFPSKFFLKPEIANRTILITDQKI